MADLFRLSASEAAASIREGKLTSRLWYAPVSSGSMRRDAKAITGSRFFASSEAKDPARVEYSRESLI